MFPVCRKEKSLLFTLSDGLFSTVGHIQHTLEMDEGVKRKIFLNISNSDSSSILKVSNCFGTNKRCIF